MATEDSTNVPLGELSPNDQKMLATSAPTNLDIEKPEFIMTPEVEDSLMGTVKDIGKLKTPMTVVEPIEQIQNLKSIFEQGLLGKDNSRAGEQLDSIKEKGRSKTWAESTRGNRNTVVNFNWHETEDWNYRMRKDSIAITFDLSSYQDCSKETAINIPEEDVEDWIKLQTKPIRHKKYRTNDIGSIYGIRQGVAKGCDLIDWSLDAGKDEGLVLAHRLPPRNMDGVIIPNQVDPNEIIPVIVEIFTTTQNHFAVPIYNVRGDLLWPKQMTHEEVAKFVEERDKEEKTESGDSEN